MPITEISYSIINTTHTTTVVTTITSTTVGTKWFTK